VVAPPGKRVEHQGIKIELLGQIELFVDRGSFYDFISLGMMTRPTAFLYQCAVRATFIPMQLCLQSSHFDSFAHLNHSLALKGQLPARQTASQT
jgi:hypothetical protein